MSKAFVWSVLILAAFGSMRALAAPDQAQPIVTITQGALAGRSDADGVQSFKGIPYAAPPVGDKRWTAPIAASGWTGTRDAGDFGASCIAPPWPKDSVYADSPPKFSEDCLFLNVWAPPHVKKAPVIVWIHGGGLLFGGSWEPLYDGRNFAKRGAVFVSINYRLGVLGWMAHPELSAQSPNGVSGNYGLLDQIQALKWVNKNIAAFGGDPGNVTIMGESAGGLAVVYLLASPLAHGLFEKAIGESLGMYSEPELKNAAHGMPSGEQIGLYLQKAVGAADLKALRAMDANSLTMAAVRARFLSTATVDGWALKRQLVDTFDRKEEALVPVMSGFNGGEIETLPQFLPPIPASSTVYESEVRKRYGDLAPEYLRLYPANDVKASMLAAARDSVFGWGAEELVRKEAEAGMPSYLYFFDHEYPAAQALGLHAFHASELPFVFGHVGANAPGGNNWPRPVGSKEKTLSDAMMGYWISFARDGVPTATGEPAWPSFAPAKSYMHFADAPEASANLMPGMYTLNEEIMERRRTAGDQPWIGAIGASAEPVPPR
ncbi:MAG TPA: carboxylesterase family protein [Rhizomicrobium sp.]|jgi:para-nitrobenzyl esterase|nr:carboxylesterase family protein [Rhizomicrobium sp.]